MLIRDPRSFTAFLFATQGRGYAPGVKGWLLVVTLVGPTEEFY